MLQEVEKVALLSSLSAARNFVQTSQQLCNVSAGSIAHNGVEYYDSTTVSFQEVKQNRTDRKGISAGGRARTKL